MISTIKDFIEGIILALSYTEKKSEAITDAILSLRKAIDKTGIFIRTSGYKPNDELSDLWLDVCGKFRKTHKRELMELSERILEKSQFWRNPQDWIEAGESSLVLIPKLRELDDACDMLLVKTRK